MNLAFSRTQVTDSKIEKVGNDAHDSEMSMKSAEQCAPITEALMTIAGTLAFQNLPCGFAYPRFIIHHCDAKAELS
jgi:hypothetical protein